MLEPFLPSFELAVISVAVIPKRTNAKRKVNKLVILVFNGFLLFIDKLIA